MGPMFAILLVSFFIQVGESDQKLADGITLCSIASDTYAKASIIGPLITVKIYYFCHILFHIELVIYLLLFILYSFC